MYPARRSHRITSALAATRDEELVTRLAEIAREEHIAVGVRMTLSPEADIASEPRWGRVMETFGEDPDLVTQMVTAAGGGLPEWGGRAQQRLHCGRA